MSRITFTPTGPKLMPDTTQTARLITPKQWETAATKGVIGYTTVIAHEESLTKRFGEDQFHLILASCKDLPGF